MTSPRCACPIQSTARDCIAIRYGRERTHDGSEEECECSCHDDDQDFDNDHYDFDSAPLGIHDLRPGAS